MATGSGARRRQRRGDAPPQKPRAHKRRRGGGTGGGAGDVAPMSVGADWKRRRRTRPGPADRRGDSAAVGADGGVAAGGHRGGGAAQRRRSRGGRPRSDDGGGRAAGAAKSRARAESKKGTATGGSGLQPIKVKRGGIMSTWKKPLCGLIRYYVHVRTTNKESPMTQQEAEEEVDRMYYGSGCCVERTKAMMLQSLGVAAGDDENSWIDMCMAIEKDGIGGIPISNGNNNADAMDASETNGDTSSPGGNETVDGRGIKLNNVHRPGEGIAHARERWTTVVVPPWAVGRSYFFEVANRSPLDLSCELFLDGEKVAFNAPLPAHATRTIRPDAVRYYQRHQWILNAAKRVKLTAADGPSVGTKMLTPSTPRYNGKRPDYRGERVSMEQYPDPTALGWQFTGSVEESRVEFFEKRMNDGGIVKLDWYYTTGTVKTTLHHPTRGRNQLFRALVSSEECAAISKNPRAHTNKGYRRKEDRPTRNGGAENEVENMEDDNDDEFDRPEKDAEMGDDIAPDANADPQVSPRYFARDDTYDFRRQGHLNRRVEMDKLQHSRGYAEWREANNKEYAVVHAKFYISMPKRMHRAPPKSMGGGSKRRGGKQMEQPLPVPEQSTVMDVKAAEHATLGTKYEVTGPPQRAGRSHVRMERIHGLTDEKEWKGDPVFEQKLYYRAENIVIGRGPGDDSDEMSEGEEEPSVPQNISLDEYKKEKIEQVQQYCTELTTCMHDDEEAEQRLRNARNKISLSECIHDVDGIVKLFHDDLIHRQVIAE